MSFPLFFESNFALALRNQKLAIGQGYTRFHSKNRGGTMAFSSWGRLARFTVFVAVASTISGALVAQEKPAERGGEAKAAASSASTVAAPDSITEGTVTVSGQAIAYRAVAGTITVGATDQQDATLAFDGSLLPDSGVKAPADPAEAPPTARIFYVAYFKKDTTDENASAGDVHLQRRAGVGDDVAAHGDVWAEAHCAARRGSSGRRALQRGEQSVFAAGRERSGVHRRAGNGFQPDLREGSRQGLLRNRPGRSGVQPFHPEVPDEV